MQKRAIALIRCVILFWGGHSLPAAGDPKVFEGVLGNQAITMEVELFGDKTISGRYFYNRIGRDISLSGEISSNGRVTLTESMFGASATFFLQKGKNDHWSGQWKNAQAKTFEVELRPGSQTKDMGRGGDNAYDRLRLRRITLKPDGKETIGPWEISWWQDPLSKVRLPRVEKGYSPSERNTVNRALTAIQWSEISSNLSCSEVDHHSADNIYFAPGVMSFVIFSSWFCGAHPDFSKNGITIDVHTGKTLSLADMLTPPKGKAMSKWIVEALTKLHPKEMVVRSEDDDSGCNYSDSRVWGDGFYLSKKGLHLGAYFARVDRGCDDPKFSVLPWSLVEQHRAKTRKSLKLR